MDTSRLVTFSDAVFAIAITLLVLAIAVPPPGAALGAHLLRLWPSYLAYAVSFLVIGAIWINHHVTFQHIVRADATLLILNLLQLMVFAFLPFPTAVLAEAFSRGADKGIAAAFYGGTIAVGGLFAVAVWQYAARGHRLLSAHLSVDEARQIGRHYVVGPVVYAIAAAIGLFLPWLALLLYVLLNIFFLWPAAIDKVTLAGSADPDASTGDPHADTDAPPRPAASRPGGSRRRRGRG